NWPVAAGWLFNASATAWSLSYQGIGMPSTCNWQRAIEMAVCCSAVGMGLISPASLERSHVVSTPECTGAFPEMVTATWGCSAVTHWWSALLSVARHERQRQPRLVLVLAALVTVTHLADRVGAEEEDLRDALARVDLGGQRRGVGDLDRHLAAPLRLQGRYVHDDAAARVRALANAHTENVPRDCQVFHRLSQREAV